MNIVLKEIALTNFMGAQDQKVILGRVTDISGKNTSGKTRIFNAWNWLLFGKDAEDRKDFNIKTLDANNEPLHRVDASVAALLSIDGMDKLFRRTYREKWQKRRGEEDMEFTGHETIFEVDGVPLNQGEYKKVVDAVLTEETFKMLTNPFYFASLRWDQRREILFKIVKPVSNETIAELMPEFSALLATMAGKPLDLFRRELAGKKKAIKDELIQVPPRIDELVRAIPTGIDYAAIAKEIDALELQAADIDKKIKSKNARYESRHKENSAILQQIQELRIQLQGLDNADALARNKQFNDTAVEINGLKMRISRHADAVSFQGEQIKARQRGILALNADLEAKRAEWARVNDEKPDLTTIASKCFACGQALPEGTVEQKQESFTQAFNADKVKRLAEITRAGEQIAKNVEHETAEIAKSEAIVIRERDEMARAEDTLKALESAPAPEVINAPVKDDPRDKIKAAIAALKLKVEEVAPVDTKELAAQLAEVNAKADELKKQFVLKEVEAKNRSRIEDLKLQERTLSQSLADLEKSEFQIDKFERVRVTMIEEEINNRFSFVKFKMFTQLINGGIEPTCEILVDGVPFGAVNNGGKIQGGMDIIRTLSNHYDSYAPIWIDNRESVTEIPEMKCQIINLIVNPEFETLNVVITK